MFRQWLLEFAHDTKVHIALFLVAADFLLGVTAAFRKGNFRMSYVADFLRNDVIGKLVPYFVFYVLALVAGQVDVVIPGLDFGIIAGAAYVTLVAAMTGSILNSVREITTAPSQPTPKQSFAEAVAGDENG
jgi:hypothetical protein